MFKKMGSKLAGKMLHRALTDMASCADPSCFNDPIAKRMQWIPLKKGGANFQTHKLVNVRYDRIEFRASVEMLFFSACFITTQK